MHRKFDLISWLIVFIAGLFIGSLYNDTNLKEVTKAYAQGYNDGLSGKPNQEMLLGL